jgi:Tfp pilus assembly protein PilN
MIYLRTSIGIELRGADLLISSLQSNFSGQVFTHFKRFPDCRLRDRQDLRQEISFFFKSKRLSKENIVLGIPRKDVVLRHLDLPAEVEDNLKQVVAYQVQSLEPVEEDKFYYDYVLLNNKVNNKAPKKRLTILLAMTRKAALDEHLEFMRDLGIMPTMVTANPMALANIFLRNRKDLQDKTFMLADLTLTSLDLLAVHEGVLVYSREVPKESLRTWGDLILLEVDEAASKVRLGPDGLIERIILAGESSDSAYEQIKPVIPECDLAKNHLGCESPEENKTFLQQAAASLGLAYTGLAQRPAIKINLLPSELRVYQSRWAYAPSAILGLTIIVLLAGLVFHQMAQQDILARALDQKIAQLEKPVKEVNALRDQAKAIGDRINSLEKILQKRDANLEALQELTGILPTDTYLTTYNYQEQTNLIQISGWSSSGSDLLQKLDQSPLFKDVSQKGAIYKPQAGGKYNFTYEMKLEK